MNSSSFFDGWAGIVRVVVVGVPAYVALVVLLRGSGKRTLSKMNAFDLVVTVAMGSTLATALLSPDVALAEGVVAFALLVVLQWTVTWTSVRWPAFQRVVKARPTVLFEGGRLDRRALRRQRVTEAEVHAAVRARGLVSMAQVAGVVLETDGSLTVQESPPDAAAPGARRGGGGRGDDER